MIPGFSIWKGEELTAPMACRRHHLCSYSWVRSTALLRAGNAAIEDLYHHIVAGCRLGSLHLTREKSYQT